MAINMRKMLPSNQNPMKEGRYLPISTLGTGTYGQVIRCADAGSGMHVAVKIAHKEPAYRRSALNELRVLRLLSGTPEVLCLTDSFEDDGRICIVGEILHKNMYEVLKDRSFEPVPLEQVAMVGRVVLAALSSLHVHGYMHCDIKPENVMLRGADDDFGNACVIDFGAVRQLSENAYYDIQSLWYRAPEVICGLPYTPLIDSWSVGALLYELHTGSPLFPGDTPQEQLTNIIDALGFPSLEASTRGKNAPSLVFEQEIDGPVSPFPRAILHADPAVRELFCSLLTALMHPNENCRMTCSDALRHPFFAPLLHPQEEEEVEDEVVGVPGAHCVLPPTIEMDGMPDYEQQGLSFDDRQMSDMSGTLGPMSGSDGSIGHGSNYSPMYTPIKTHQHSVNSPSSLTASPMMLLTMLPTSSGSRHELLPAAATSSPAMSFRGAGLIATQDGGGSSCATAADPFGCNGGPVAMGPREPPVQSWLLAVAQPPLPIGE